MISNFLFWKYRKMTRYESWSPLSVGSAQFSPMQMIDGFMIERKRKPEVMCGVAVYQSKSRHTNDELHWLLNKSANDYLLLISKKRCNVYVK